MPGKLLYEEFAPRSSAVPKPRGGLGGLVLDRCLLRPTFGSRPNEDVAGARRVMSRFRDNWVGFVEKVVSRSSWGLIPGRVDSMSACDLPGFGYATSRRRKARRCGRFVCPFCWSRWVFSVWSAVDYVCFPPDAADNRETTPRFQLAMIKRTVAVPSDRLELAVESRLGRSSGDDVPSRARDNNDPWRAGAAEAVAAYPTAADDVDGSAVVDMQTLAVHRLSGGSARVLIPAGSAVAMNAIVDFNRVECARFVGAALAYPMEFMVDSPAWFDRLASLCGGRQIRARYGVLRGEASKFVARDGNGETADSASAS